jgi:hypothetical protein
MMAKTSISDRDLGLKKILLEMKKVEAKPSVKIGVQGSDATARKRSSTPVGEDTLPITVVEIATFHEYGLGNNPERSFLRATLDKNRSKYFAIAKELKKEIFKGNLEAYVALGLLGEKIKTDCVMRITEGIPPPLTPERIEQKTVNGKAGQVALIDTGQLRQSITWVVQEREEKAS